MKVTTCSPARSQSFQCQDLKSFILDSFSDSKLGLAPDILDNIYKRPFYAKILLDRETIALMNKVGKHFADLAESSPGKVYVDKNFKKLALQLAVAIGISEALQRQKRRNRRLDKMGEEAANERVFSESQKWPTGYDQRKKDQGVYSGCKRWRG